MLLAAAIFSVGDNRLCIEVKKLAQTDRHKHIHKGTNTDRHRHTNRRLQTDREDRGKGRQRKIRVSSRDRIGKNNRNS